MTKAFRRVLVAASALVLTGVLALAASPVQASSVDQRIDTLEQELVRLKKEQTNTREQAIAAQKKMPLFIYRPGNGLTIAAADDKWEIQFGNRLQVYWTFWTNGGDGSSIPKRNTVNGVLQIRRFRPYINMRVADGFYDLRFKWNTNSRGGGEAFDAEMYIHFEQMSPWLPYFGFGASPSAILNPQDNNCSSKRCGRSEQSLGTNGVGLTTGSNERTIGFVWRKIPRFGPTRVTFLNVWMGQDRLGTGDQFDSLSGAPINRDGRALTLGIGVKPFDKMGGSFGKVAKGLELSFGTVIQQSWKTTGAGAYNFRTNQTRAQRISMIRTDSMGMTDTFYYYTVGVGYKWKWVQLRLAGDFSQSSLCTDPDAAGSTGCNNNSGRQPIYRSAGYRLMGEFWLWSPKKGLLAGNPREGGLMVSPMFQRQDVTQSGGLGDTLRDCAGCKSAHAINTGIALWYYLPGRFMNVGVVWDHWACTNCNSDVSRVVRNFTEGGNYDWDTITLISRFQF